MHGGEPGDEAIASLWLSVFHVWLSDLNPCSSRREQAVMRKTFIFLALMLIVLPSIGLARLVQHVHVHMYITL